MTEEYSWLGKIPWTTVFGIILGLATTVIVWNGMTQMGCYGKDYNGFAKEFLSVSLVVESLVFGIYIGYMPKKKYEIWNDSVIVYWITTAAIPFSIFLTIWGIEEAWMEYSSVEGIRFLTGFATFITYSSIYAIALKTARKALFEMNDEF